MSLMHVLQKLFMKTTLHTLLLGAIILGTFAATSQAAILLQIKTTNASSVEFFATTNNPSWDVFLMQSDSGFTLMDFFTSDSSFRIPASASGTLTAPAQPMVGAFNYAIPNNYTPSYGNGRHLSVWQDPRSLMKFASGGRAFSGTLSVDLSLWASLLNTTEGYIGEIRPGNGNIQGASMGQFQIIPEPGTGTLLLVGVGVALFAGARRVRKIGPMGLMGPIRPMKLMKTTLLSLFALSAAFLLTTPVAHAQPVTASGNVTPFPSPNPLPNDWLVGGPLIIGDTGTGSLLLENYVGVYSTVGRIGNEAGSDGTVTVNSSSYWESSSDLFIGRAGTGKMVVGQYGTVGTVDTSVADQAGSTGTVEITGWGSSWDNSGDFYVGRGGTASLTVGNIAELRTRSLYTAMDSLHGTGNIYAKGVVLDFSAPGDKLIFDSTHLTDQTVTFGGGGNMYLDIDGTAALGVGFRGAGEMVIQDALKVSSSEGYLGMMAGSAGTGTVTGAGSEWNITSGLYAGQEGRATLFIGNGGKVSSAWGSIDSGVGFSSSVYLMNAGSVWTNANQLVVGEKGQARLQALNGGRAVSATGVIGSLTNSYGQVFIQGTNSTWIMTGDLKVGVAGQGDLHVENGGVVSNAVGYVGAASGGVGNVIVTGTGSQWNNSSGIYIGDAAYGQLDVIDDGRVTSVFGSIGDETNGLGHATISGVNAVWTNASWLAIGERGIGTLTVQNGGRVESGSGLIGNQVTGTGAVTVIGTNSTWAVAGSLYVGKGGTGTLRVTNGGNVTAKTLYTAMTNLQGNGTISANGLVFDSSLDIIIDGTDSNTFGNGGALHLDMDGTGVFGAGYKDFGSARIRYGAVVRSTASYLGLNAGSGGSVDLDGAGSAWLVSGDLHVGNNVNGGYSQLMIWDGAKVSAASVSINSQSSNTPSQVSVDGTTSVWTNSGTLTVGESGHGAFTVFDATATSGSTVLGKDTNSSGQALVHGLTGHWDINGTLTVGENGTGTLTISNGGTVNATGALTANAQSTIYIGAGSSLTAASATTAGELLVDGAFQADTTIQSGGSVGGNGTITGNLTLLSDAEFVFTFNKTLTVTGTVSMDSSFGIASLLGLDDTVAEGTYTLIDGTTTDFSLLGLQNWGYNNRYQISGQGDPYKAAYFEQGSLVVQVVPEPGTSALLLLGLGAALFARARRISRK